MTTQDIRWIQRLQHFAKALDQLRKAVEKDTLNKLEEQGLIQAFENTYHTYNEELAEKVADAIRQRYFPQFVLLQARMESFKESLA